MTPQIFAAMFVTVTQLREQSWRFRGGSGHYSLSAYEAAVESCKLHMQDRSWADPLALLYSSKEQALRWARPLI